MFESLKLSEISGRRCEKLREPSSTRPALWVVEEKGVKAVVKDYSVNGYFYRNIIGRFLIWRERRAYKKLKGLKGVPVFYRVIDGLALVIEKIPGKNMEGLKKNERIAEDFFIKLRDLVESFHQRGLVHCDLKRAPNILIDQHGDPYLVDWSASIAKKEFGVFPLSCIYQRFLMDDLNGIIKIQLRHCPDKINHEDKQRYYYRSRIEKFIRGIRDSLRNFLQKVA